MREFNDKDFPPFLNDLDADHVDCVGVETTLAEMASLGYSLAYYAENEPTDRRFPNAQFLQPYGNRRVFTIINFPRQSAEPRTCVFIEIRDDRDAEAIRQSLQDQLNTEVEVETLDPEYNDEPCLEGYRWFKFHSI